MLKVLRYRIYPTKSQRSKMADTLEPCRCCDCDRNSRKLSELTRWAYNETLAVRKNACEQDGKSVSYYETKKLLPQWKEDMPELKNVHSQVLQEVVKRVDLVYQAFFRRVKDGEDPGYPRFKGKDRYDSFAYTQSGLSLKPGALWLSTIGDIKIKLHRAIVGEIQRLNIRRMPTGKWFVSFLVEVELVNPSNTSQICSGCGQVVQKIYPRESTNVLSVV